MSATAPRTAQAAPDLRPLGIALLALTIAMGLLVAVTVSRQASVGTASAPAAVPASVAHDHGWIESTYVAGPDLTVNGFDRAHAVNAAQPRILVVTTADGGLEYTGIPYAAPADSGTGGSNGTRFAR